MARIYPIPTIGGSVSAFEAVDVEITTLVGAGTLTKAYLVATDGPSGGDLTAEIRNATAGGGDALGTVTITDGTQQGTASGSLAIAAAGTAYLRVTTANGALNLSGWVEVEEEVGVTSGSGFTTLALVKDHAGITGSTHDARLTQLISGVTDKMQNWMDRDLLSTVVSGELHSPSGLDHEVFLKHYPVQSISTLTEKGVTLTEGTDFAVDLASGTVTRKSGTYTSDAWTKGLNGVSVDYTGGYATLPNDIVDAATEQVRHEFHQMQPSARDALGIQTSALDTGGQSLYVPGGLLPATVEAMRPYRRLI